MGDGEERSGVASSDGTASDSSVVGSGVAGVPSAPTDGEQAATSAARTMSASTINGLRAWRIMTCSPVRVPTCGQPRRGVCRPRLRRGNDPVTGSVSANDRGRRPAGCGHGALPPSSAACSAAIARPRPEELPAPAARRVRLVEAVEQVGEGVGRDARARGRRRSRSRTARDRRHRDLDGGAGGVRRGRCRGGCRGSGRGAVGPTRRRLASRGQGDRGPGRRAATTAVTTRPRSTPGSSSCSASASKREISMQVVDEDAEAADVRDQQLRGPAARRAASPASRSLDQRTPRRRGRSAASAARARRRRRTAGSGCCDVLEPADTVASSESAIRLKSAAQRPNSSRPPAGTRAARSPVRDPPRRRRRRRSRGAGCRAR